MAVLCFECGGKGESENMVFNPSTPIIVAECKLCGGTGKIRDEQLDWIIQGMLLKEFRLKQDVSMRKAARFFNVEDTYINEMERGIIEPWAGYDFSPPERI